MRRTLLIGLGNPGDEYAGTYHNAGWEFLDFIGKSLEREHGPAAKQSGKNFHFLKYGDIHLIYPDTYMNMSGGAVRSALDWFGKAPSDAAVFQDDSDLAVGEYKIGLLSGSGDAGHRGMASVMDSLPGDEGGEILRVRIGIRDPLEKNSERPRRKAGDFVLKKISKGDVEKLSDVFQRIYLELSDGN